MGKRMHSKDGSELHLEATKRRKMATRSVTTEMKRRQVLGVSELLENIIVFLPTADIIRCMRVCRIFKETIEASPPITAKLSLHGFDDAPSSAINPLIEQPTGLRPKVGTPQQGHLYGRTVEIRKRFWGIRSKQWEADLGDDPGLFASIMLVETKPRCHPEDIIKSRYLLNTIEICHPLNHLYISATKSLGLGSMKQKSALDGRSSLKTVGEAIKRLEDWLDEESLCTT